ncbi:hairy-related 11 [Trichomycterus rosablanca]|uniref:hairy-related 11 n=1 Tax=Trichomycterus rosablanca TaxID=2290929 RepID=UPI002F35F74D
MAKTESMRRKLKPVIEKKRRDRINQNLSVLRALLFRNTADTRLQNPKLEKAEILDLAVQYIRRNTQSRTEQKVLGNKTDAGFTQTLFKDSKAAAHLHQCVSDFTAIVGQMHQSNRENVLQNLEHYLDCHQSHSLRARRETAHLLKYSKANLFPSTSQSHLILPNQTLPFPESSLLSSKPVYQNSVVLTPPDQLSPPPSPLFSSLSPAISTSPSYLSVPLCLPFGHSVSPPSTSPHPFTIPNSACSSEKLHQSSHPNKCRDLHTPPSPSLDMAEVFPLRGHTAWRPWN